MPALRRLAAANIFILFIWLIVPFTTPGPIIWKLGCLEISRPGLELCLLASIKANAILLIFLAAVAPLGISRLGNALFHLHCPRKLVWLILLMGRDIDILEASWNSLNTAARLRGFRPGMNAHSYRTIAAMLALLLVRASDRADRMHEAMLLRGFCGKLPFTETLRWQSKDNIPAAFTACFLTVCCWLEYFYESM